MKIKLGAVFAGTALALTAGLASFPTVAASGSPPQAAPVRAERQPNILFVLVDDMGFADLSITGNTRVETPNIDRLAREGMVMSQFYDAAPICSPSRAGFMTGQFPARNRFVTYIAARQRNARFGQADWLDPKLATLPRALRDAGYATGHFGKWHLGGGRDVDDAPLPTEYGFDESYTQFEGLGARVLPTDLGGNLALASAKLGRGSVDWLPRARITARYVDKTLAFVKRNRAKPWFAQLWLDDVHTPWNPDAKQLAAVAGKARTPDEARFLAVLVAMDAEIGRMVEGLRRAGELDDTVIIFTSDNGPTVGADTPGSAGPYRGRKASLYEGGLRQPLIVRWPGAIRAGSRDATTVAHGVDLFPTLARIGGAGASAAVDGVDLSAAWRGKPLARRPDLFSHINRPDGEDFGPPFSIRSGPWKLLANADGTNAELYNLDRDPQERQDLAASQPALKGELTRKLTAWVASLPLARRGTAATPTAP